MNYLKFAFMAIMLVIVATYIIQDVLKSQKRIEKRKFIDSIQIDVYGVDQKTIEKIESIYKKEGKVNAPNYNTIITDKKRFFSVYDNKAFNHQYYVGHYSENKPILTPEDFFELIDKY